MPVPELPASRLCPGARRPQANAVHHCAPFARRQAVDRHAKVDDHAGRRQGITGPDWSDDLDRPLADGAHEQRPLGDRLVARHPHAAP